MHCIYRVSLNSYEWKLAYINLLVEDKNILMNKIVTESLNPNINKHVKESIFDSPNLAPGASILSGGSILST